MTAIAMYVLAEARRVKVDIPSCLAVVSSRPSDRRGAPAARAGIHRPRNHATAFGYGSRVSLAPLGARDDTAAFVTQEG